MRIILYLSLILFSSASILPSSEPTSSRSTFYANSRELDQNTSAYISYANSLLSSKTFYGNWLAQDESLATTFVNEQGYIYMHYESDFDFDFGFEVYDGEYMDQQTLTILYGQSDKSPAYYDVFNSTLWFDSILISYQVGQTYGELGEAIDCNVITTVFLIDTTTGLPFLLTGNKEADLKHLGVQFQLQTEACNMNFITSVLTDTNPLFDSQGVPFFIVVLLFGLLQSIVCYLLDKLVIRKESYARKISPWSLLILNAFDLYFLLATAYFFMSYSPIYEISAVPFGFLAFFFEPRVVWRIFKIHGRQLDARRRSRLEIKSYFGILLYFLCLLVSLVVYPNFVYLLASIFMLPQIKHNFSQTRKYRWNVWILFGLGVPKVLLAIYTKLDPNNLLRITPDPTIISIFLGLILFQLLLLYVQTKNPRFGFGNKSAYKIYVSKRSVKSSQEVCAICLERLKGSIASETQSLLNNKNSKMMILTPCKHEFHLVCLTQWVKSKLECPYCRSELPPPPDDDDNDD